MIRNHIKNIIFRSLNYDVFNLEDFTIENNEEPSYETFVFKYDKYYFYLEFKADYSTCKIEYVPGSVITKETESIKTQDIEYQITEIIRDWLKRVKQEISSRPQERLVDDKLNSLKELLDEKLKSIDDIEYFTKDESDELKRRLDELEEVLVDSVSKNADLKTEVDKMKKEVRFMKSTVDTLAKKNWLKKTFIKMYQWSQKPDNKEIVKIAFSVLKNIPKLELPELPD